MAKKRCLNVPNNSSIIGLMVHRYEGVAVAKVRGIIQADSQEEAREMLACREYGFITDIALQGLTLMDDLDPREEDCEESENGEENFDGLSNVQA